MGDEQSNRLTWADRERIEREHARVFRATIPEVLGLSEGASLREVQSAYYALAQQFHPDVFFGKDLGALDGMLVEITQRHFEAYSKMRKKNEGGDARQARASDRGATLAAPPPSEPPPTDPLQMDAMRQFEKGLNFYKRNDYVRARPYLELACAYDPDNVRYREHLDRVRRMLGEG